MTNALVASIFIIAMGLTIVIGLIVTHCKKKNDEMEKHPNWADFIGKIKTPDPAGRGYGERCLHSFWQNGECKECGYKEPDLSKGYEYKEIKGISIGMPVPNGITKIEYKDGKRVESVVSHEQFEKEINERNFKVIITSKNIKEELSKLFKEPKLKGVRCAVGLSTHAYKCMHEAFREHLPYSQVGLNEYVGEMVYEIKWLPDNSMLRSSANKIEMYKNINDPSVIKHLLSMLGL